MSKTVPSNMWTLLSTGSPGSTPASPAAEVQQARKSRGRTAESRAPVVDSENSMPALPATPASAKSKPAMSALPASPAVGPMPMPSLSHASPARVNYAAALATSKTPARAALVKAALEPSTSQTPARAFASAGMMAGGILGASASAAKPKLAQSSKKGSITGGTAALKTKLAEKAKRTASVSSMSSVNSSIIDEEEAAEAATTVPAPAMSPVTAKRTGGGYTSESLELKDKADVALAAKERLEERKRRDSLPSAGGSRASSRRGSFASLASVSSFEPADGFFSQQPSVSPRGSPQRSPRCSIGSASKPPRASAGTPRPAVVPSMRASLGLGPKTSFAIASITSAAASPQAPAIAAAAPAVDETPAIAIDAPPKVLRLAEHSAVAAKLSGLNAKPSIVVASEKQAAAEAAEAQTQTVVSSSSGSAIKEIVRRHTALLNGVSAEALTLQEDIAVAAAAAAAAKAAIETVTATTTASEAPASDIDVDIKAEVVQEQQQEEEEVVQPGADDALRAMVAAAAETFRVAVEAATGEPVARYEAPVQAQVAELPVSIPSSPSNAAASAGKSFGAAAAAAPAGLPELPAEEVEVEVEVAGPEEEAWESPVASVEERQDAVVVEEVTVEEEDVSHLMQAEVEAVSAPAAVEDIIIVAATVSSSTEAEAFVPTVPAVPVKAIVSGTEGRGGLFGHYTSYKLSVTVGGDVKEAVAVERRYREFLALFEVLSAPTSGFDLSLLQGYTFPAKVTVAPWRSAVVQERVVAFNRLLGLVAKGYSDMLSAETEGEQSYGSEAKSAIAAFFGF